MHPFRDSASIVGDGAALRARLAADGYLFLPGLLPAEKVAAVRRRLVAMLADLGWVRRDGADGLAARADLAAFRDDTDPVATDLVCRQGASVEVQRLQHHPALTGLFARLFDGPVLPLPRILVRNIFPRMEEHTTPQHQDYPHVQGSRRLCTAWIPIGDCAGDLGGLRVATGSHRNGVLPLEPAMGAGGMAVPGDFAADWAWSPMRAGDVLVFNCLTVHQGIPNRSDAMRISVDLRYQPAGEPVCADWLTPFRGFMDWDAFYAAAPDAGHRYYWRGMDLVTVPFDTAYYDERDAKAFAMAEAGDRRALSTLRRIATKDADAAKRARAAAAIAALEPAPAEA
ncbi:MAG: phytanoyl-CoA dioxygenase family protein [Alphaproteobacteria bacterium]